MHRNVYEASHDGKVKQMHDQCMLMIHHHVQINMTDGSSMDGIIEKVTPEQITMLVGEDVYEDRGDESNDFRQFYGGYRPRPRYRRFRRRRFPLSALTALALFPYYYPPFYPYPYPYSYPYSPYYPY